MDFKSVVDQMGSNIIFPYPPKKIISLVPSQTELLADLGLDEFVCGITKFCVHPHSWIKNKATVGGTKHFNFEVIEKLQPDLILANKEENYKEGIETLKQKFPVWVSDIITIEDALEMIASVGNITDRADEAAGIIIKIQNSFSSLLKFELQTVLYLIWKKPWMAAANETFINTMLEKMGLVNCLNKALRYPEITNEEISLLKPDLIFLSSEPYPFKEQHIEELKAISPTSKVMVVDGEIFSWYGSRLIKAPAYIDSLKLQ